MIKENDIVEINGNGSGVWYVTEYHPAREGYMGCYTLNKDWYGYHKIESLKKVSKEDIKLYKDKLKTQLRVLNLRMGSFL